MLIGVMSDSHDRAGAVRTALGLFDRLGVEHVIHCGDVGGTGVFDQFIGRPFAYVWGNTDDPDRSMIAYLDSVGLPPPTDVPLRLELDGARFAVFHGHEREFEAFRRLDVDYVLHGHTHVARDDRVGRLRVINPGALHRAARKSVATIDTVADRVEFHSIDASG